MLHGVWLVNQSYQYVTLCVIVQSVRLVCYMVCDWSISLTSIQNYLTWWVIGQSVWWVCYMVCHWLISLTSILHSVIVESIWSVLHDWSISLMSMQSYHSYMVCDWSISLTSIFHSMIGQSVWPVCYMSCDWSTSLTSMQNHSILHGVTG